MPVNSVAPRTTSSSQPVAMLGLGSHGPQVLELQRALAAAGFDPHGFDGSFGPKTLAAVKAFQKARGLVVDGRVGPQTWGALRGKAPSAPTTPAPTSTRPTLREGDVGESVRTLQTQLIAHGQAPGPVDGKFGAVTRRAVVAFQRAHGLSGTGVVDAGTWAALAKPASTAPVTPGASGSVASMLGWCRSMIGSPYAAVNPFRFGEVLWDGKPHKSENGSDTVWNYPKGTRVFDCSGFVVAAYRQLGVDLAAHGLYSSGTMATDTKFLQTIPESQLAPGDLIVYQPHNGIGHVVIYLGNGQTIECAGGSGVKIGTVDWARVRAYKHVPVSG